MRPKQQFDEILIFSVKTEFYKKVTRDQRTSLLNCSAAAE